MLRNVLSDLANTLREQRDIDESESFIVATFASAKGGGQGIGKKKQGKGLKIMGIVDRLRLPLAVCTHAANHHEVTLMQLTFDFYMIEAKPEKLIGDKTYDRDDLDNDLRKDGIGMIAPHRENRRKEKTQDSRKLRRYERRRLVERFFTWIQWHRHFLVRWEYYAEYCLGIVQLASIWSGLNNFEIGSNTISEFHGLARG